MKEKPNTSIWSKKTKPALDIDSFIKASPKESQAKLQELRDIIESTAPDAQSGISYRMPVYKYKGKQFIGFAGFKQHIGFYPMSGTFLKAFRKDLVHFETSKGTIRFPLDKSLPTILIKKMLKAKMKEIDSLLS